MANEFDSYREALVMEEVTEWPDDFDDIEASERQRLEKLLHASAEDSAELTYERSHTGFVRRITVTESDLRRIQ